MASNNQSGAPDHWQPSHDLSWQVLDSLTAGIAVLDKTGSIRAVNDAWKQFCIQNGGSPEKTGVGVNYLDVCRATTGEDSDLAELACHGIEEVLSGTREVFKLEYPCHSPTQQRWFLLYASRLKESTEGAVTAHLSITERKRLEQQLVETERLAAIGQAMQGLSHEGRNALQRAQGCIDLLRFHIQHDREALQLVDRLENAQRHMLSLYEEVKSYASPIKLKRQPCRLDRLVEKVWANIAYSWTQASFSHLPSENDLTCNVDPAAIGEVLRLIFENAMTTGVASPEIEVAYAEDELDAVPAVTVIISDNGPGVSPETADKVFEPFYTTKQRGTGLGLAICKRIVSAHDGRIYFGELRQTGAAVHITLPASSNKPN